MKKFILLLILSVFAYSKKLKINKNQKTDIPEDIKQVNAFLEKSSQDFDDLKKQSAISNVKLRTIDQNLDLNVPHIEDQPTEKTFAPVRSLDDEEEEPDKNDSFDDMEKRTYSIEDKLNHILVHFGHDIHPHPMHMTPFGPLMNPHHSQNYEENKNSLNHALKIMDHFHPMHHSPMMHPNVMMGIGHGNPLGVGLDHHYRYDVGLHFINPFQGLWGHHRYDLHHPYAYGGLGHGFLGAMSTMYPHYNGINRFGYHTMHNPFSTYADEREEERMRRYDQKQKEYDDIFDSRPNPLMAQSELNMPGLTHSSSSMFLI